MAHSRRTDARFGQPVVEVTGRAIAEVPTKGRMNRRQNLLQHEDRADHQERAGQLVATLHGADQPAHCNGEPCRRSPASEQDDPPGQCQPRVGLRQRREEHPLLALAQTFQQRHG